MSSVVTASETFKARLRERLGGIDTRKTLTPEAVLARVIEEVDALQVPEDVDLKTFKEKIRQRIEAIRMHGDIRGNANELKSAFRDIYNMSLSEDQRAKL